MLPPERPDRICAVFDDHPLVANAGLILPVTLAHHLGLGELVDNLTLEDLGDLVGTCEMCETQAIRYLHYMEHPDYDGVLGVGSVCAGHMEEDYAAAREREKQARSRFNRRVRWLEAKWRVSARGNHYLNRNGFNVVVYRRSGRWAYRIEERGTGECWSESGVRWRRCPCPPLPLPVHPIASCW